MESLHIGQLDLIVIQLIEIFDITVLNQTDVTSVYLTQPDVRILASTFSFLVGTLYFNKLVPPIAHLTFRSRDGFYSNAL